MPPLETETSQTPNRDAVLVETQPSRRSVAMETRRQSSRRPEDDPVLRALFYLVVYLCIGMFIWIVIAPASWLFGRLQFHREVTLPWLESIGFFWILPYSLMTKFQGHTLVEFTHILPGALWVALIPFQLHPTWRKNHKQFHRIMGYLFVATSLSIASGIFLIQYRKLTYDYYFDNLPPRLADTIQIPTTWLVTLWFAGTGVQSVRMARAGEYQRHQVYMLRHVGAGLWVSTQRMIIFPSFHLALSSIMDKDELSDWLRRELFGGTANLAMLLTAGIAEFAIHRLKRIQTESSSAAAAAEKKKLN